MMTGQQRSVTLATVLVLRLLLSAPAQRLPRAAEAAPPTKLDAFSWMAGNWELTSGSTRIEEDWTSPARDMMIGMSQSVSDLKTVSFEFIQIESRGDGIYYVAHPQARLGVPLRLLSWDGTQAIFVNPGHADHLKRILYRKNSDGSMTGRIEGEDDGKPFARDFPYHRKN
jgi:Domain of unknown function (DUF6265)